MGHSSFPSSERLVRILGSIVEPATANLAGCDADGFQGGTVGAQSVGDDRPGPAMPLYCALQKLKRSLAVSLFRGKHLQYLALVIHGAPEIERLAIDLYEGLVEVPAPKGIAMVMTAAFSDLRGKQRTEPVPPQARCLMANVDATFMQ